MRAWLRVMIAGGVLALCAPALRAQVVSPFQLLDEQPMSVYSEQAGRDFGATALMFPNTHFDPVAGSRLYNEYIEQYQLA